MNTLDRPPTDPLQFAPSPGDHDDLLRAFFRSEMPDPWPALDLPEPVLALEPPAPRARTSARSRASSDSSPPAASGDGCSSFASRAAMLSPCFQV